MTHAGENSAVGDHEILGNAWVGDDDEELVAEPERVEGAEFLVPVVEGELGVVRQEGEGSFVEQVL